MFGGVPYWNVTAVDQGLQHRLFLAGVQVGQVVERGADRPVHPLGELAGQMFGGTALKLPMQNVPEKLQRGKGLGSGGIGLKPNPQEPSTVFLRQPRTSGRSRHTNITIYK